MPGADLHQSVTGTGPVRLTIPGGAADAGGFAGVGPLLADRYAVVAFDPPDISRGRPAGPAGNVSVEALADDAHRLLAATGAAPVAIFASRGGGRIGLALAARHPEPVRTLVVRAPPAVAPLPGGDRRRAGPRGGYDRSTPPSCWEEVAPRRASRQPRSDRPPS